MPAYQASSTSTLNNRATRRAPTRVWKRMRVDRSRPASSGARPTKNLKTRLLRSWASICLSDTAQILADHNPQHHFQWHKRVILIAVDTKRFPSDRRAQASQEVILGNLGLVYGVTEKVSLALLLTSYLQFTLTTSMR